MKIIILIKRKPGLSKEEFRRYYDDRHADFALQFIRPYLRDYRRSYPTSVFSYFDTVEKTEGASTHSFDYDCVTEMWFDSKARMEEMFRLLATESVRQAIAADEDHFIDPRSVVVLTCEESRSEI